MTTDESRVKPPNYLEIHAGNHPDKPAVIGPTPSLTYGQLRERARSLAKSLYGMGCAPATRSP